MTTEKEAAKAPKRERKPKASKYDKDAVTAAWEKGMRPAEIAALDKAGIKGISQVYVSRILYGNENSGGISKEQTARRKEQERRDKQAQTEREKAEKTQ